MKYRSILELDNKIERIIDRTVKHYYTDWKNYDRPKYMGLKGSEAPEDKELILIARECGTYLLTLDHIASSEGATAIYTYFQTQEKATYYYINLNNLELKKIDPAVFKIRLHERRAA